MSYRNINYSDFGTPNMSVIPNTNIKLFTWDKKKVEEIIDTNNDWEYIKRSTVYMPFSVYIISRDAAKYWDNYRKQNLSLIKNCVYILFGHDFIYAGKAINGDRIFDHMEDKEKDAFEYQMLIVPDNKNGDTQTNWTSMFMEYLESLLIDAISKDNKYCHNKIKGKCEEKNIRDLNIDDDKIAFGNNVVDLIFKTFTDITYSSYLISNIKLSDDATDVDTNTSTTDEKGTDWISLWQKLQGYSDDNTSMFATSQISKGWSLNYSLKDKGILQNHSISCVLPQNSCRVELVGWGVSSFAEYNLKVFDELYKQKDNIENEIGCKLIWDRKENNATTRISVSKKLSYKDESEDNLKEISSFFTEYYTKFINVFTKYIGQINLN